MTERITRTSKMLGSTLPYVVIAILCTFMYLQAREVAKVPKLEEQVEALAQQNRATMDELSEARTAYQGLSQQNEQLFNSLGTMDNQLAHTLEELGNTREQLAELTKHKQELLDQVKSLKNENTALKKATTRE